MDNAYAVCGYVYLQEDPTYFVNLNRSAYLENITINISITLDNKTTTAQVKTSSDGFYFYHLGKDKLGASVAITVATPSKDYSYAQSDANSSSNYKFINKNLITSSNGISTTFSSTANQNFFLYFCSTAFVK